MGKWEKIATGGGFFTYFIVMRLLGFPPNLLFGLVSRSAIIPMVPNDQGQLQQDLDFNSINCTFDPYAPNLGCYAFQTPCTSSNIGSILPNWLSTINSQVDLRGVYSTCLNGAYVPQLTFPPVTEVLDTWSHISGNYVRYTTETIFYAQSAYFVTVVMVQWSNVFACKSRKVKFKII